MTIRDSIAGLFLALVSAVGGFGGSMAYVGSAIRQIEVDTAAIVEIRDHGTGMTQTLIQEMKATQADIEAMKRDFRPREYWETNAAKLAALETKVTELQKVCTR